MQVPSSEWNHMLPVPSSDLVDKDSEEMSTYDTNDSQRPPHGDASVKRPSGVSCKSASGVSCLPAPATETDFAMIVPQEEVTEMPVRQTSFEGDGDAERQVTQITSVTLETSLPGENQFEPQQTRGSTESYYQKRASSKEEEGEFIDRILPEDVAVSFGIRGASDFEGFGGIAAASRGYKKSQCKPSELKHLHGLDDIFPESLCDAEKTAQAREQEKSREQEAEHKTNSRKSRRSISKEMARSISKEMDKHINKMMFDASSWAAVRIRFILSTSAVASCLYVSGFCAVAPGCEYGHVPPLKWMHLVNSIVYALVAIPSRGLLGRIDWKLGVELKLPREVLHSHLSSPGLYCDILALAGLLAEIAHALEAPQSGPMPTPTQWLMLIQIIKCWRIILPEDHAGGHGSYYQGILNLLFTLVVFAHTYACCFLLVGNFEISQNERSWLDTAPYNLDMQDCVVRYTETIYFGIIGLSTVGYSDLLVTALEHDLNSFLLMIAQLYVAKVCAELTWLTHMHNQHESEVHERRRSLVLALDKMGAPRVLMKRALAFQSYETTMHADNIAKDTFSGLGKNLFQELQLCTYRKLVLQAPFLRGQPTEVISFIVRSLFDEVYLPADFIVRAGEHGRELFFVRRGEASAYLGPEIPVWGQSVAVANIRQGSYFGELAMLTGVPRGSFVMASTYCICSILPYSAVEDLVDQHPEAFTALVQTMVRIYDLKPQMTWKGLTMKFFKRFGLENDYDAFVWLQSHCVKNGTAFFDRQAFDHSTPDSTPGSKEVCEKPRLQSHSENPTRIMANSDPLLAKAFDLALQRLRVTHLDRRIFWSELDEDCSGGISFEEFEGRLHFRNHPDPIAFVTKRSHHATIPKKMSEMTSDDSEPETKGRDRSKETETDALLADFRSQSKETYQSDQWESYEGEQSPAFRKQGTSPSEESESWPPTFGMNSKRGESEEFPSCPWQDRPAPRPGSKQPPGSDVYVPELAALQEASKSQAMPSTGNCIKSKTVAELMELNEQLLKDISRLGTERIQREDRSPVRHSTSTSIQAAQAIQDAVDEGLLRELVAAEEEPRSTRTASKSSARQPSLSPVCESPVRQQSLDDEEDGRRRGWTASKSSPPRQLSLSPVSALLEEETQREPSLASVSASAF